MEKDAGLEYGCVQAVIIPKAIRHLQRLFL
nr:MAG TPA: hypothetical protein [Bacteriophage sp.]